MKAEQYDEGLNRLAAATRTKLSAIELDTYSSILADRGVPLEVWNATWVRLCQTLDYFPRLPELLEELARGNGPSLEVEATRAYERVLSSAEYMPAADRAVWTSRRVRELCGDAAQEAWLAAGGDSAFQTTYREGERRKAFLEAYRRSRREGAGGLPDQRALPPAGGPPTADEAEQILRQLAERFGPLQLGEGADGEQQRPGAVREGGSGGEPRP